MHFYGIVLLENSDNVENDVAEQLEQFDESLEVEPYIQKCWECDEHARIKATKKVEKEFDLKWNKVNDWSKNKKKKLVRDKMLDKIVKYQTEFRSKNKPLKSCETCKGAGEETTLCNPDGKFDWYRIGGRWNGEIQGRTNEMQDMGTEHHFSHAVEQVKNNILTVKKLLEKKEVPYTLVVDGNWLERPMEPYGKPNPEWIKECIAIYKKHPNHVAIGIDYHS